MLSRKHVAEQALYSRATGQVKNMGMLAFMMWMSGSQIHLFSIMMTFSGVYQPLMAIINSGQGTKQHPFEPDHGCVHLQLLTAVVCAAFPDSESDEGRLNVTLPRLLFCLINLGGLAFALWKINGMGLLPTTASDYIAALQVPKALQSSFTAFGL